ncbi:helix-turn-helix domain-containing protein [Cryptosporangium sp. NPDC048952]|uniref:helix-turn-helix domain-containing protein n=1 Tax=Cryptosporangium sp. NPDC048952 TaxID=3363961 RepID=UPI0037133C04
MRSARAGAPGWDITVPVGSRLPGVAMAAFSDHAEDPIDVEMVPHPAVALIIDLGDGSLVVADGDGNQRRGGVVAGLAPRSARGTGPAGGFDCLQIRLSPVIAHAVLGEHLTGQIIGLDDLWARGAVELRERLRAAETWDERFAIAETTLARRIAAGRAVDPEVAHCWARMRRGRVRVDRLAADVGWSRKRLWSRFRSQLGLTPKHAARLIRFDDAAHRLAAGRGAAVVAAESGYADQSHLHREVLAFADATPAAVAAKPFLAIDDVAWPATNRQASGVTVRAASPMPHPASETQSFPDP